MAGKFYEKEGGFVIDKPGSVLAIPIKADGTEDLEHAIRNVAKINTITVTNTRTKTDIGDGNAFYPAGNRVTALAGTLAIEFTTMDLPFWGMAAGSGLVEKTGDTMIEMFNSTKIDETTHTLTFPVEYKTGGYVAIKGSDGTVYTKATDSGAPSTAGKFSIAADEGTTTITFAAADAGKVVSGQFQYTANTVSYTQGQKPMSAHKFVIKTTMSDLANKETYDVNVIISQATIGADTTDALQKDPSATKTLTFDIVAPLPGEEPYQIKMVDLVEE